MEKRRIVDESFVAPGAVRRSESLDDRQSAHIAAADTFFIATWLVRGRVR